MDYSAVVQHFGSMTKLAKLLDVSPAAVSRWRDRGIPIVRQFQIELLSGGALCAPRTEAQKSWENAESTGGRDATDI